MVMEERLLWKRVVLKLSGELLAGGAQVGIDLDVIGRLADDIISVVEMDVEIGVVIGGGNLFRGSWLEPHGSGRVTGDHMGMMATVMNALAMREALCARGLRCKALSGLAVPIVCETFTQHKAISYLSKDKVVLFCGGIGSPFFTTDTTAALRAVEMDAKAIIKATDVDGVYSADPKSVPDARRHSRLSFDEAINLNLKILDTAAFSLARDAGIPIVVYSMKEENALEKVLRGAGRATIVSKEGEG